MPLELGKSFNRSYSIRAPFLDGFYNIGIFFHKNSNFLLFSADPDFTKYPQKKLGTKINMFKNLESSKFCETFLELHNYRSDNLDITNQFNRVKDDYYKDVVFTLNESVTLSKLEDSGKTFYNTVMFYGLSIAGYENEFLFLIAERQHIVAKLKKKMVRTTGVQLATSKSSEILDEFHREFITSKINKATYAPIIDNTKILNLSEVDKQLEDEYNGRPTT